MGGSQIGHHPAHGQEAPLARRPGAVKVAVEGVDVGLVDGDVLADQISQGLHHLVDVAEVVGDVVGAEEGALLLQPERIAEVVQGEKGPDAPLLHGRDLFTVVVQSLLGEYPLLRLDAAPLQAEAVALKAHVRHQVQVLPPANIVLRGYRGVAVVLDVAPAVPVVPVVVLIAALDLGGGGGGAQEHPGLERIFHKACPPYFPSNILHCKAAEGFLQYGFWIGTAAEWGRFLFDRIWRSRADKNAPERLQAAPAHLLLYRRAIGDLTAGSGCEEVTAFPPAGTPGRRGRRRSPPRRCRRRWR